MSEFYLLGYLFFFYFVFVVFFFFFWFFFTFNKQRNGQYICLYLSLNQSMQLSILLKVHGSGFHAHGDACKRKPNWKSTWICGKNKFYYSYCRTFLILTYEIMKSVIYRIPNLLHQHKWTRRTRKSTTLT